MIEPIKNALAMPLLRIEGLDGTPNCRLLAWLTSPVCKYFGQGRTVLRWSI